MGEFPKIRGTLIWGPYNKDPTIVGTISGSPIFGNSHICILTSPHKPYRAPKQPPMKGSPLPRSAQVAFPL